MSRAIALLLLVAACAEPAKKRDRVDENDSSVTVEVRPGPSASVASTLPSSPASVGPSAALTISGDLNLALLVVDEGIGVKTSAGNIAPGCKSIGPGLTIPKREGKHDLATVTTCLRRIKDAAPGEKQVVVTAGKDVEYRHLIEVLDAARADAKGELFPEFQLGVARP